MYLENFQSSFSIWNWEFNLSVKPACTPQSWIKTVWPVRCCDDNDFSSRLQAVHLSQQLRYDSLLYLSCDILTLGSYRIYLVYKDYRWGVLFCFVKNPSYVCFALSIEFVHYLRSGD